MPDVVPPDAVGGELPDSPLFEVLETPTSGRGIYATTTIPAGTKLLTCEDLSLYVIFREYRKEVCAWCFAYDRGRTLVERDQPAGLVWCDVGCRTKWSAAYGAIGTDGSEAITAVIAKLRKAEGESSATGTGDTVEPPPPTPDEISSAWRAVRPQADLIVAGRKQTASSSNKASRKAMQAARQRSVDPDHLLYLWHCVLFAWANRGEAGLAGREGKVLDSLDSQPTSKWTSLLSLTASSTPYTSHEMLTQHINGYLLLLTVLPNALLSLCNPDILLRVISVDNFNSFGLRSLADDGAEMFGFGCWPSASYWNHSCEPNVRKWREGRAWMFESSREIEVGQECCISYLGGDEAVVGREKRRAMLRGAWGFECGCAKCAGDV